MHALDELRQEGRAEVLLKLLTARFGTVPGETKAQPPHHEAAVTSGVLEREP